MIQESISLSARWSLAVRELDLHPDEIVMLLPDLARWTIAEGFCIRCIGVKGIDGQVAVRVVRTVRGSGMPPRSTP